MQRPLTRAADAAPPSPTEGRGLSNESTESLSPCGRGWPAKPEGRRRPGEGSVESEERARVVSIARSWLGTPFRDQGKVKGKDGAVDCAMLLVAVFQEAGLLDPAYDPRPYPPQFHLHHGEERFLKQIARIIDMRRCGAEKAGKMPAVPGDVIVYRVGRCFSHGGLVMENGQLLHAYYKTGEVSISGLNEIELVTLNDGSPRPRKIFDLWA